MSGGTDWNMHEHSAGSTKDPVEIWRYVAQRLRSFEAAAGDSDNIVAELAFRELAKQMEAFDLRLMGHGVIDTTPATGLATIDVRDASSHGLALMKERVENQRKMISIAIKLTSPDQWVVFAGDGKESIYPTGGAGDTILRRAFGLTWGEKTITLEDTPDGRLATCSAWLMRGGEKIEHFTGYRLMGGYVKTEADLRRAVLENLKSVAVRDLLGLRFRTPAELKEMGLDVGKIKRRAEFQSHDKDPNTITVPFGKNKGQSITDIDDTQLKWLADAMKKAVADPEKAKWKTKNQALLDALRDEYKRRHGPAEKTSEPGNKSEDKHDPDTGEVHDDGWDGVGPKPLTDEEAASMRETDGAG